MKNKRWAVMLCFVLALAVMAGCQSSTSGSGNSATASDDTTVFGQVSSIDGNSITLALGTMSQRRETGEMPSGEMPSFGAGEMPSGGMPSFEAGEMPSGGIPSFEAGEMQGDNNSGVPGIELTGEKMTITVTDDTVITVQGMGANTEGSLSDIEVSSILSVTMSGDAVTAITVMPSGGMPTPTE